MLLLTGFSLKINYSGSEETNRKQAEHRSEEYESEVHKSEEYKGEDYRTIWELRAKLEVDKDNDSCGDPSEAGELVQQRSVENTEEHELIKNVSLASSSSADQKLSVDSGKPPSFNNY